MKDDFVEEVPRMNSDFEREKKNIQVPLDGKFFNNKLDTFCK